MLYTVFLLFIYLLLVGMAAGWLAWVTLGKSKVLQRSDRKPNWTALLGLGVAGSLVGGLAVNLIAGDEFKVSPSGMVASFVGALLVVAIYIWMKGKK